MIGLINERFVKGYCIKLFRNFDDTLATPKGNAGISRNQWFNCQRQNLLINSDAAFLVNLSVI